MTVGVLLFLIGAFGAALRPDSPLFTIAGLALAIIGLTVLVAKAL